MSLNVWQRFGLVTVAAIALFVGDAFLWDGSLIPFSCFAAGSLALAYGCIEALRASTSPTLAFKLGNYAGIVIGLTLALVFVLLTGATLLALRGNS